MLQVLHTQMPIRPILTSLVNFERPWRPSEQYQIVAGIFVHLAVHIYMYICMYIHVYSIHFYTGIKQPFAAQSLKIKSLTPWPLLGT